MSLARHLCREIAFQVLFAWEFRHSSFNKKKILDLVDAQTKYFEQQEKAPDFLVELVLGILAHMEQIQKVITTYAPEWPLEKINPVDRSVLYIGVYELLFTSDIPGAVAIDEAVELGKKFGDDNSSKFINGVLNSVLNHKASILSHYVAQ